MKREGFGIAHCTVERLMKRLGLKGARRGKVVRTTINDMKAPCPLDRVNRQFKADRPNQLWVLDFTCVSTWQGWLYVAFVIDVYALVGWRVSSSMHTDFLWTRWSRRFMPGNPSTIAHCPTLPIAARNVSIRYSERLTNQGVGGVGNAGMGVLVQPSATAWLNRVYPARGS